MIAPSIIARILGERISNRLEVVAGRPVNLPATIGNLLPVGGMYVFVAPILFAIFSGGWVLRRSC